MATLIATADGNLTGSSTFAAAEVGALALNLVRNTTTTVAAAASVTSATFTVTTAKVIDAVLLWVKQSAAGSTGTFKVDLQKSAVSQASVTVNKTDLPDTTNVNPVPVLFKLTSTATGDGAATWTIVITTTGTNTVTYNINAAGATNLTRALRTATTQAPAAADDLYVVGELTGAGTHNSRTVTMDSTAATAYGNGALNSTTVVGGGVHISNYGMLTYGTTASTNYLLRVNGDLMVYQFGTLNIVSPQTSTTQVLEFQQVSADGDFGLRCLDNSTVTITGQPRTAGKAVVKCKLTADVASSNVYSGTMTVNAGTATANNSLEASGNSLLATGFVDSAIAAGHSVNWGGSAVTNTTQTATVWLARGSGTNNRYVRVMLGNNGNITLVTNGFYSDIDLQIGTAGTVTAVGTGTATSVSITPIGIGYLVRMTGKVSSGSSSTPAFVLAACSAAGTISYTGNATQNFIFDHASVVTAASISDTTFTVDTDTGWLSGDAVCVASTTRTASECEIYPLNANAGLSSFTSALYPFGGTVVSTHSGTAPTQAEIGLLTRNVKVRSTSNTLMSYVYCTALATVTASWAEFYYVGATTANKHGIEIDGGAVCNPKSFTYCSLHDLDNWGLYCNTAGVTSLNVTFSNNVVWNNYAGHFIFIFGTVTNTDWTFDNNLTMRSFAAAFLLNDVGGTCTNNTAVGWGAPSFGFSLAESTTSGPLPLGTFNGNTAHSGYVGINVGGNSIAGTINNFSVWRNNNSGVQIAFSPASDLVFNNLTVFGNVTANGQFVINTTGDAINITGNSIIAGDTTFPSSIGIGAASGLTTTLVNISGLDMSGTTSIFTPHTSSDIFTSSSTNLIGQLNNCKFGAPTLINSKVPWMKGAYLGFEKFNRTAGDHRTEMTYGQLRTDATVYHTLAPSMKMTPNNASNKLESAPQAKGIQVAVNNGDTVIVSVWVRKDSTYTGAQPRLIVRANVAIGINSDTVLATYASGTGSWNQISGTSVAATDDGVCEFIVDCDGTAGFINVDDWSLTTGGKISTNDMGNWFNGLPAIGTEGGGSGGGAYFSAGFV